MITMCNCILIFKIINVVFNKTIFRALKDTEIMSGV